MTWPFGAAGATSSQVMAVSPRRAAGLPPIMTDMLPVMMVARLVGGTENGPPCGMWGGVFVAPAPTTAAGLPPIMTFIAQTVSIVPLNGCGSGVGIGGPGGAGIRMMWMSVAMILSPSVAAGWPICSSELSAV